MQKIIPQFLVANRPISRIFREIVMLTLDYAESI